MKFQKTNLICSISPTYFLPSCPVFRQIPHIKNRSHYFGRFYKFRYLKQDQIKRLFFSSTRKCQHRLKYLYDTGLLGRFKEPIIFGKGTTQYIYSLTKISAEFIKRYLGVEKVSWKRKHEFVELLFLKHTLAIADFYISIKEKEDNANFIKEWNSENDWRELSSDKRPTVRPDAFFIWRSPGEYSMYYDQYCLLEIDRGTMSSTAFAGKIRKYAKYFIADLYNRQLDRFPNVLTVTPSEKRLVTLKQASLNELNRQSCHFLPLLFYFTTQERIKTKGVLSKIWQRVSGDGMESFDDFT